MAIKRIQLGGSGLVVAADPAAMADDALQEAYGCDFGMAGCVSSGRGRTKLYELGDAIAGCFEGAVAGERRRYALAGTSLYEDGTSIGTMNGEVLSGVSYNGWVYLADGSAVQRWDGTTLTQWGLDAPGYMELEADPITVEDGVAVVTVAVPTGHGLVAGRTVEIRQAAPLEGIDSAEVNAVVTVTGVTDTTFTYTPTTTPEETVTGGGSYVIVVSGPTVQQGTAAGTTGLTTGTYKYAYTFWNGSAESNFSAWTSVTLNSTSYGDLSDILVGPEGTISRRIYRTDVNGNVLFFLTELQNNVATTYLDYSTVPTGADPAATPGDAVTTQKTSLPPDSDVSSSRRDARSLGAVGSSMWIESRYKTAARREAPEIQATNLGYLVDWLDHDRPPTDLRSVFLMDEQLWGVSDALNACCFSLTGQPEHFPVYNRVIPGLRSNGTLRTALPLDRDVYAYTDEGIHRITKIGLSWEDLRMESVDSPVGIVGNDAVTALPGISGHVFMARDGLYYFDGTRPQLVSKELDELFTDEARDDYVNPDYMTSVCMAASRRLLFVSYGTSAANDRLLVADITEPQQPKFFIVRWGLTRLRRESASGAIVAGDSNGNVWQLDVGWTDNEEALDWTVRTKRIVLEDALVPTAAQQLYLDADFGGAETTVAVTAYGAAGSKEASFSFSNDTRERLKRRLPAWMVGESFDVRISSSAAARRRIYSVGLEFEGAEG